MLKRKASELADSPPRSSKTASDILIDNANSLPESDFIRSYIDGDGLATVAQTGDGVTSIQIDLKYASQLTATESKACFDLVEATSRQDYESSSWGWHPRRKKREMREKEMRYLLVRSVDGNGRLQDESGDDVQGFVSFMLTHDSIPSVPVVYVYEIHLRKALRKLGLGAHLMRAVESIAQNVGVDKVMLTCFVSNERARGFYGRRGYTKDISSPEDRRTRNNVVKADYVIMSKAVYK